MREILDVAARAPSGVNTQPFGIPPEQLEMCGMSLGYADPDAPENRLETHRETADSFAVFHHDRAPD